MAGFIVLEAGRAYSAANGAYDIVLETIAEALPETEDGRASSNWLTEQLSLVQGPGLGNVDLRELTPDALRLFSIAPQKAFTSAKQQGSVGLSGDHALDLGWLDRFQDLLKMMKSVRRGEPPSVFNALMSDLIAPTRERVGPGWDNF